MFDLLLILICVLLGLLAWRLQVRNRLAAARHGRDLEAERMRFEHAEHTQTARLEAVLDGMIEGLIVLDADGRIARVNPAAEAIFGISRMMAGGTLLEAVRNHDVAALASRATQSASPLEQEIRIERPSPRLLRASAVGLRDAAGQPAGAVLVFHDVTRLRQLEAMREDFVANVSHELRTPLSVIKSAVETLLDGGRNDAAVTTRFLEIIDKHATRLASLIDDLLMLARLDADRVELKLQPVPLRRAVQEAFEDAAPLASSRRVTLDNQVLPGTLARADPGQLLHVFGNLIGNAIKYGREQGHVTVTARETERGVEVAVRDDGPGIPPEAKARVFERFYRVDKGRSREQGGTGLGLSIVKHIVQAHGGDVRVESEPGQGTEFFFTLPVPK